LDENQKNISREKKELFNLNRSGSGGLKKEIVEGI
jgi:hypothetical protein